MAYEASSALRAAWQVLWPTRTAVLLVAVFAALSFGPAQGGLAAQNATRFDTPQLTHALADPLLAPLARWDAVWYLRVADGGYGESEARAAFFPLYPLLVRSLATPFGASRAALLLAAYAISLAAFLAALALLWRLVALELGERMAQPALLLLAVFPAALYFGAPYAESVFLALSVGAFYAARTGRWAAAGGCAAAAAATRNSGVLLMLPLALICWGCRERRLGDGAWILVAPLGLAAFALYLGLAEGDPLRFAHAHEAWYRELKLPVVGAWDALVAAWDGLRQVVSNQRETVYFSRAGGDPIRVGALNLMLFAWLAFGVAACVGVFRRLPPAYGAWVAVSLLLPLSEPVGPEPLMSLPRFLAVLFPIFMWLALWCEERGATARVAAASALGLGLFTAQFATWHWIS
jgi:Mannosyltransferase (PIG-V)